uniref:Uncharacterized protein n=1 Tax=Arundo donax TaxID=35708 RepID=A0A0A9FCX5_ARUDO
MGALCSHPRVDARASSIIYFMKKVNFTPQVWPLNR